MSDENVNDAATPRSVDQQQACSHAWCAWCGKWGDHTSGGCKSLALDSRVAREEQATVRLLSALRLIAAQNCQTKAEIKEMVATMRRIARDAIESHENASDQATARK